MTAPFISYWNLALASVGRQLVAAASACKDRGLGDHPPSVNFREIAELVEPVTPVHSPKDSNRLVDSGHKIQVSDKDFRATLKWLQDEIRELLSNFSLDGHDVERKKINHVLKLDADETALHFGTITEGWDRLVTIKHRMLLPDDAVLARSAWLVSLLADFERSLRDAICLPVACLGRQEPISKAFEQTIDEQGINLQPRALLRHARTEDAAAQVISEAMAKGIITTLGATRCFARHLGIFDFEGNSFKRGFHVKLKVLGTDSEAIFSSLIDLRRVILHDTFSSDSQSQMRPTMRSRLSPLEKWEFKDPQVIAQFLYSYSIHYTLSVMEVVSRAFGDTSKNEETASVARYKAASELRVATLDLLKKELWWLAWSLADYVRERYEDPDSSLMLQLNAAFAQSQIKMPRDWKADARAIEVDGKATRYRLLKKSILGEWAGISPIIREAITSPDMTLDELATWPALEPLRARPEYNKVLAEFGRP